MIIEPLLDRLHLRSHWMRLIVGVAFTALAISLGTVVILSLFGFPIESGIPAALAAVGAAIYAARLKRGQP